MKSSHSLLLALITLVICSCKEHKDDHFETDLTDIAVTHDQANITAGYELHGNSNYLWGGLCWSEDPMPDMNDDYEENQYLYDDESYYTLEDLYANHTYHARSYLILEDQSIVWSEDHEFQTAPLPAPPCSPMLFVVDFGSFQQGMNPFVCSQEEYYYSMDSDCDLGNIEFRFKSEPQSGIYHTGDSFTSLEPFEFYVVANIAGAWNCVYQSTNYKYLYVDNDGQGHITLSFCDIIIATDGGCFNSYYSIMGQIANQ